MIKPIASLLLSGCLCVSTWIGRDVGAVDGDAIEQQTQLRERDPETVDREEAIEQEIRNALRASNVAKVDRDAIEQEMRNALRDLETQLPESLKSIRINVQVPEINVQIPEIHVPEIQIPRIHVQAPREVQKPEIKIPEINIPEIRIQSPSGHSDAGPAEIAFGQSLRRLPYRRSNIPKAATPRPFLLPQ